MGVFRNAGRPIAATNRGARGLLLALMLFAFLLAIRPAETIAMEEDELKAAFLNYFFQLVRWPEGVDLKPVRFCAAGESRVTSLLKQLIELRKYEDLEVDFALIASPKEAAACDYVFISSDESDFSLPVIATTRGKAILTVSDVDGFANAGGVVELKRENSRVAVIVNMDALSVQGLQASSKLLSVAQRRSTQGSGK